MDAEVGKLGSWAASLIFQVALWLLSRGTQSLNYIRYSWALWFRACVMLFTDVPPTRDSRSRSQLLRVVREMDE